MRQRPHATDGRRAALKNPESETTRVFTPPAAAQNFKTSELLRARGGVRERRGFLCMCVEIKMQIGDSEAAGGRRRPSDFHADFFGDFTRKISSFFREGRLEKGFWRPLAAASGGLWRPPAANDFFVNLREFLSSGPTRRSRDPPE